MKKYICLIILIVFGMHFSIYGQTTEKADSPGIELIGNLSCDINSKTGAVQSAVITIGDGGTGQYKAVMVGDPGLLTHTIFRPKDLSVFGGNKKLPIVTFANGGCRNSSGEFRNFLSEIASHGFLVISIGPFSNTLLGGSEMPGNASQAKQLLDAVDWAITENSRLESELFARVDVQKVAVMGQSCGGNQALSVSADPRITTTVMWNSGLFATPPTLPQNVNAPGPENANLQATAPAPRNTMPMMPKSDLKKLHAPIAYFTGGISDIATPNAADDVKWIDQVPVFHGSYDFSEEAKNSGNNFIGHYPATYREPNGGDFAKAGVAWLEWQLKGDKEAEKMFIASPCGLEKNSKWSVVKKNIK